MAKAVSTNFAGKPSISQRALAGRGQQDIAGVSLDEMKIVKKVTYPTLSQNRDNQAVAFIVNAAMSVSTKDIVQADGSSGGKRATLVYVTDLADGIEKQYVVPSILASEWQDSYPDDSYVGKAFAVRKLVKRDGKRYRDLDIVEIDGADFLARVEAKRAEAAAKE